MALKVLRWGLTGCLATIPFIQVACGSSNDRNYVNVDASAGGSSGTGATGGGGTGATGGGGTGATGGGGTGATGGAAGSGGQAGADGGTPCTGNADCDDNDPCNGTETCSGGYCKYGTPLADGTVCATDAGADGGAEKVCFNGNCIEKCTQDSDCDDGDVCTGVETCGPSKVCQTGTPLSCDDNSPCTDNKCDPQQGCYYPLIDADGDGHAATSLGSCGDDCNDSDPTIYTGAQELCDNKDNNCNGQTDELAPTWYSDCDGDTFAPAGAPSVQQCTMPTSPDSSCTGVSGATWTSTAPAAGTTDCWDKNNKAHPYTAATNNSAWQTVPITGAPTTIDFDYNCDGTEEPEYTNVSVSTGAVCFIIFGGCSGVAGWVGSTVPACGASASYSSCFVPKGGSCGRYTTSVKQPCR